jgi:hypothetical protein
VSISPVKRPRSWSLALYRPSCSWTLAGLIDCRLSRIREASSRTEAEAASPCAARACSHPTATHVRTERNYKWRRDRPPHLREAQRSESMIDIGWPLTWRQALPKRNLSAFLVPLKFFCTRRSLTETVLPHIDRPGYQDVARLIACRLT